MAALAATLLLKESFDMEIKNKKVFFLGDSITQGVGASSGETKYTRVYENMPDGLHPSDLGMERIADMLNAFLSTI